MTPPLSWLLAAFCAGGTVVTLILWIGTTIILRNEDGEGGKER
jgi:hypothetical protein